MFEKYKDNRGTSAIEYGILAVGIAVVIVAGITVTGINTKQTFCTISSAVGSASGECSKKTSTTTPSSTSTNNNNTNNLIGVTTKAQFDALNASLKGQIDMTFVSDTFGGDDYADIYGVWKNVPFAQSVTDSLESINSEDPITNVFGLYDSSKKPLTSYQNAISGLDEVGSNPQIYSNHYLSPEIEVTTKSGGIYLISYKDLGEIHKVN